MKYLLLALLLLAPSAADAVWFDASWDYRVKVTIDADQVSGSSDHTSFPVYIDLSDLPADFHTNVKSDGCDIRVVESDETTETAFELVDYDDTGDTGELHAMVDTLSYNSDTDLYIYYGNSSASCYATNATYGAENVWGDYTAVYHLENTSDATGNGYTLTNNNTVAFNAGIIGDNADFGTSNTNKSLQEGTGLGDTSAPLGVGYTSHYFSTMVKRHAEITTGQELVLFHEFYDGIGLRQIYVRYEYNGGTRRLAYRYYSSGFNSTRYYNVTLGTTAHHIVAINDSGTAKLYLDGSEVISFSASVSKGPGGNGSTFYMGGWALGDWASIEQDEFRADNAIRSADWITTEYNNQSSPSTFYTVGTQETDGGGGGAARRIIRTIMY